MKLDDYKELEINEIVGNVPTSNVAKGCTIFQLRLKQGILGHLFNLLKYDGSVDDLKEYVVAEDALKRLCNLCGRGTIESPYSIFTPFASGGFVDIHYFMNNKTLPSYIENNACHKNCYLFAMNQPEVNAITGIYKIGKDSHLHSVVEVDGAILDFNWGIAMSKELYMQLFNFEELNSVNGKSIRQDYENIIKALRKMKSEFTYAEILACYDEVKEIVCRKLKDQQL